MKFTGLLASVATVLFIHSSEARLPVVARQEIGSATRVTVVPSEVVTRITGTANEVTRITDSAYETVTRVTGTADDVTRITETSYDTVTRITPGQTTTSIYQYNLYFIYNNKDNQFHNFKCLHMRSVGPMRRLWIHRMFYLSGWLDLQSF
ncbi:hypothetical protein CPB86DRAFT_823026 [Serendipita vermifera]|nr:hypothetical protein CPB86DRAFT_823026 [Serendipita vermifera]